MKLTGRLREPIYIPRWVLTLKYAFFFTLAGLAFFQGLRTLDLTTPASYTPFWCAAVAIGAAVALPSSLSARTEFIEKWAAAWIAGWLGFVAVNSTFVSTGAGWLFVLMVALLPTGRALHLFSQRRK